MMETTKEERSIALAGAMEDGLLQRLVADADWCAELDAMVRKFGRAQASSMYWERKRDEMYQRWSDSRKCCADLEAQLQQSRDDYETALREHEKTSAQLRDAKHDLNNALQRADGLREQRNNLRAAINTEENERCEVEAENVKLRAEVDDLKAAVVRMGDDMTPIVDAAIEKVVDPLANEVKRLRAGMEKVREFRDEAHRDCLERWAATYVDDELTSALSIAGVERGETIEETVERLDNEPRDDWRGE